MANQYSGRKATPLENANFEISRLNGLNNLLSNQVGDLVGLLTSIYKKHHDPDIARMLVIHGVNIWGIDKELGRESKYTTPRSQGHFINYELEPDKA